EAVHEMLARLLPVADDVDPGVLLGFDGENGGVALDLLRRVALEPPRRPQPVGLRQPCGLRQAPGYCRLEHVASSQAGLPALLPAKLTAIIADERPRGSLGALLGDRPTPEAPHSEREAPHVLSRRRRPLPRSGSSRPRPLSEPARGHCAA